MFSRKLLKLFGSLLLIILENSSFIFLLFLSKTSFHFFSCLIPCSPIFLHSFKISFGTSKGSYFHFNFFLTRATSFSPRAAPWEDALPDLLGEPYPIIVLQEIKFGFFYLKLFFIALDICFSLCPFTS